ncbi:MAG TPA: anti-sigma F factor [Candidatus Fournierella excrementavium]|nr:anti-sigma F factor [Candidatus Fournierella excrementavium]
MKAKNLVKLSFYSRSVNEGFARGALAAFLAQTDPTVPELADVKTAVSEAVTNCIVHAYPGGVGLVHMSVALYDGGKIKITITDKGVGIADVEKAMQPMFTTGNPEERAGLGFAVMQSFMDKVKVTSKPGQGTRVVMTKTLAGRG